MQHHLVFPSGETREQQHWCLAGPVVRAVRALSLEMRCIRNMAFPGVLHLRNFTPIKSTIADDVGQDESETT